MTCASTLKTLSHHQSDSRGPRNDRDLVQSFCQISLCWLLVKVEVGNKKYQKVLQDCLFVCLLAFPLSCAAPPLLISNSSEITHPPTLRGTDVWGGWIGTFPLRWSGPMSKHSRLLGSQLCWIPRLASASQLLFELSPDRKIKSGSKESCKQCAMSHLKAADASFGVTCCGWWVWMMWGFR